MTSPQYSPLNILNVIAGEYTAQTGLPYFDRWLLVVQYGIEPFEMKPDFSLLFGKYWSKLQTVSK